MHKIIVSIFLSLLLATSSGTQAKAPSAPRRVQPLTANGCLGRLFMPAKGDLLYEEFGPRWTRLLDKSLNPDLQSRIIKRNGMIIALLYPHLGDTLCVPNDMLISDVVLPTTSAPGTRGWDAPTFGVIGVGPQTDEQGPIEILADSYGGIILGVAVIVVGAIFLMALCAVLGFKFFAEHHAGDTQPVLSLDDEDLDEEISEAEEKEEPDDDSFADPVTSGKPYVLGGLRPDQERSLDYFFDMFAIDSATRAQADTQNIKRIGDIQKGTIVGEGFVGYAGGKMKHRIIFEPIRAYQALFLVDGKEEYIQALQGCMNPVWWGQAHKGFTFTPDPVAELPAEPPTSNNVVIFPQKSEIVESTVPQVVLTEEGEEEEYSEPYPTQSGRRLARRYTSPARHSKNSK